MFHIAIMGEKEEICQIMYGNILRDLTVSWLSRNWALDRERVCIERRPLVVEVCPETENAPHYKCTTRCSKSQIFFP